MMNTHYQWDQQTQQILENLLTGYDDPARRTLITRRVADGTLHMEQLGFAMPSAIGTAAGVNLLAVNAVIQARFAGQDVIFFGALHVGDDATAGALSTLNFINTGATVTTIVSRTSAFVQSSAQLLATPMLFNSITNLAVVNWNFRGLVIGL